MEADNTPAPLFLAANPFAGSFDETFDVLCDDGASPQRCLPDGCIRAGDPAAAVHGRALREGFAIVADEAAQLVCTFVPVRPGSTVVEVGAGRGTKTLLLQGAAVARGGPAQLFAVDQHEFKSRLLAARLASFDVPDVVTLTGDATDLAAIAGIPGHGLVDAVLVDAPCSGLGTLRRHPEKRWRVTPNDIDELAALGIRLLSSAASLVRPGGFVVYSTCTLADAENARVIETFLGSELGRGFSTDPLGPELTGVWAECSTAEGYFRSLPERDGPDGHFAARLVRSDESG
jgi:16S rRNA (cytosine967-C5)-methyltransferase